MNESFDLTLNAFSLGMCNRNDIDRTESIVPDVMPASTPPKLRSASAALIFLIVGSEKGRLETLFDKETDSEKEISRREAECAPLDSSA